LSSVYPIYPALFLTSRYCISSPKSQTARYYHKCKCAYVSRKVSAASLSASNQCRLCSKI